MFAQRMNESVAVRRRLASAIARGGRPGDDDVAWLRKVLPEVNVATAFYEVSELEKDLVFLEQGEAALRRHLEHTDPRFAREVAEGAARLGRARVFVTDRDGTINGYCARYRTSVQSVWNAVMLDRFARQTEHALVLTAAPLPALLEVITAPDAFAYAGSKGREWVAKERSGVLPLSAEKGEMLAQLNRELGLLLALPENEKFVGIGSGLQQKVAETVIARQDISRSIAESEVERFTAEVRELVQRIDREGTNFRIEHRGKDIEIEVVDGERPFHKGDGLRHLDAELGLELAKGSILIAGDTASDLPMIEAALAASRDTRVAFVTKNRDLADRVRALSPDAFIASSPDVLVWVLGSLTAEASDS